MTNSKHPKLAIVNISVPHIWQDSLDHCALHKFIYLLTYHTNGMLVAAALCH